MNKRWDTFRQRRFEVNKRYVALKKRQKVVESLLKQMYLMQIIKVLSKNYDEAQHALEVKLKGKMMSLIIAQQWKRRVKRWGGSTEVVHTNILRRFFTFLGPPQME